MANFDEKFLQKSPKIFCFLKFSSYICYHIIVTMELKEAFKRSGLTKSAFAKAIFPDHLHPVQAFEYRLKTGRELRPREIQAVADLLGKDISQIDDRRLYYENGKIIIHPAKGYRAVYYPGLNVCDIFETENNRLIAERILVAYMTPISVFFEIILSTIKNNKKV